MENTEINQIYTASKKFDFEKIKDLSYGENLHQKAALYRNDNMVDYEVIGEKELTYNNILDITEAVNIVSEFYDVNCVAIVNHNKPCAVALGTSIYDAYTKAFDCDPISSFNGIVAFSKPIMDDIVTHLNSMDIEAIVAPAFSPKVIESFKDNPSIKLVRLKTPLKDYKNYLSEEIAVTPFGVLIQDFNKSELDKDKFKVVTKTKPTAEQIEDAVFAWKIAKYAKTTSVVIAKDFKTAAISQGHTNVINAVENALNYACDGSKEAVLSTDSVLRSEECIYAAVQGRIGLIIQPGGTLKDEKLIEICDKYNISMITTGIRNYRQ